MNISVLGCGRWGSFLAWYLNKIGHDIILWGREDSKNLRILEVERKNEYVQLSDDVVLTNSLEIAINQSDILIISINAQNLRLLMEEITKYTFENKTFVLCMKGLEETTGKRLSEIVKDYIGDLSNIAVWVGPGHVQDFTNGTPNCMVLDSDNCDLIESIIEGFSSDLIRFYYGKDMIGNEVGAASKNVMGIAAGILDGLGFSSLKGALMARGAREISRLVKAMGGDELTVYGLCHLGDYEATLFSAHSHNRKFGELLVQSEPFEQLTEGVPTVKALMILAGEYNIELPISKAIYSIIVGRESPKTVLMNLFLRSVKSEF